MKILIFLFCVFFTIFTNAANIMPWTTSIITGNIQKSRLANSSTDHCIAPCAVMFDASGTIATGVSYPFHELFYSWNFNDSVLGASSSCGSIISSGEGYWACGINAGSNSKNIAYGPEVAHIFETAGTYTVSLTIFNGINTTIITTTVIVEDPNTYFASSTYCYSTSDTYTGCPSIPGTYANSAACKTANHCIQTSNFNSLLPTTARRTLLRRGETFTTTNGSNPISVAGPGILGAYGTGAQPKIAGSFSNDFAGILNFQTNATDWRIVDLEFDGTGETGRSDAIQFTDATKMTILRCYIHNYPVYGIKAALTVGHTIDEWVVQDSIFSGMSSLIDATFGMFAGTTNAYAAVLGTSITLTSVINVNGHSLRLPGASKVTISNNTFTRGLYGFTNIDYHGYSINNDWVTDKYSELAVIADNVFNDGTVSVGPQNSQSDERIRNIIIERNFSPAINLGSAGMQVYDLSLQYATVRNNISIDSTSSAAHDSIGIVHTKNNTGREPAPDYIWIYNNSFYAATTLGATMWQIIQGTHIFAKNNLAYSPSAVKGFDYSTGSGAPIVIYDPNTATTTGGNTSNAVMKSGTNLNITTNPPTTAASFKPIGGSYTIGNGVIVPNFYDYNIITWLPTYDTGAVKH